MKKCILLLFCINFHLVSYNQVIKGIVLDKNTRDTISFATVFQSGTFVGTNSDLHGHFALDISKYPSMPITISAVGYYSSTQAVFSPTKTLIVYLMPKVYELREVVIKGKSLEKKRKANLRVFNDEFLGTTNNARYCYIQNENNITFNYGSDKDTLKAYASMPIIIYNNALGYKIAYFLDKFEYYRRSSSFIFKGTIIFFSEDLKYNESQRKSFERKRKNAYSGSRMNFFRTLWANESDFSEFSVSNSLNEDLVYNKIVIKDKDNNKFFSSREKLTIAYYNRISSATFLKDRVFFDRKGYYDPEGISWEGDMASQRVADWLPYEY